MRTRKSTGAIIGAGIGIIILVLALGYAITVGLTGLVLWALCKLGVITAWTWGQAALWAIIVTIVYNVLRGIFGGSKKKDD